MQQTDKKTIAEEQRLVRELAGLDESATIVCNDVGWGSRVYIVNSGEIVFKFPRSEEVKREYALEVSAYRIAHEVGGVSIPQIKWEHPKKNYLGYIGIVGESLDEVISALAASEKRSIGVQLGTFLRRFHERAIVEAPLMSLAKESAKYRHRLELGLPDIKKHFTETEVDEIRRLVEDDYPQKMLELGFRKGLCHGDLGYWNIICRPNCQIGIVDFGDVGYYDTSIDFAGMNDQDMLDAALETYGGDVSREKIELRMKVIPVLELPFFVGRGDRDSADRTAERIRRIVLEQK